MKIKLLPLDTLIHFILTVDIRRYTLHTHSKICCRDGYSEREKPCFQHQVGETHRLISNVRSRNHKISRSKRVPNVHWVLCAVLGSHIDGVVRRLFAFMDVRYVCEHIEPFVSDKLILRVLQDVVNNLSFERHMGMSVNHTIRFYDFELPEADRT